MSRFVAACLVLLAAACSSPGDKADADGRTSPLDALSDERTQAGDGLVTDAIQPFDLPDGSSSDAELVVESDGTGADSGDADETTDAGPDVVVSDFGITFVTPVDAEEVGHSVWVRLAPLEAAELVLDDLTVTINGQTVFKDAKLPTEFVLDTRAWDKTALDLKATAKLGDLTAAAAITIGIENPDFGFKQVYADRVAVSAGGQLEVLLATGKPGLDVTADFLALDSGYQPGDEVVTEIGGGKYKILYTVSETNAVSDGHHPVPITISDGDVFITYDLLEVFYEGSGSPPIRVLGGIFVPEALPEAADDWSQPQPDIGGNDFIITGGSAKVSVDFSALDYPQEIIGVLLAVDGFGGYYQVPLGTTAGEVEIQLLLKAYLEGEQAPDAVPLLVALRDVSGRVSPVYTRTLTVTEVGSGDVQVSISWDTETDVDLHVIEPAGYELWYGDQASPSGGTLDLDSNPACDIDGVNNENVFWPPGMAPLGTYVVRVDFYSDCTNCGWNYCGANYTVTVNYCGDAELFEGSFDPGDDDAGGEGSGVEVTAFSNENCGQVLRGRIRYQDRVFDKSGVQAQTWRPARHVLVEVHRKQDNKLLATGTTDRYGDYEIQFGNKEDPGIYIVVQSVTDFAEGLHPIAVMNHPKFKQVYAVSSTSIDESESDQPRIDFDIPEIVGAGAFNILDVLIEGYDGLRLATGKDLGQLEVYWATGADTTDTIYCSPYLYEQGVCSEQGTLSVQGKDTDRDEYDDMVVLKEFFKLALDKVSKDDNPGGAVDGTRDDPRRAWTDGVSTFFAADALGMAHFVNSRPHGVYIVIPLESQDSPFSYGTASESMDGPVSPLLVSALLRDLADAGGEEAFDGIDGGAGGIYDAIFNYLPSQHLVDRGVAGVDLVDLLDGWLCRGWDHVEALLQLTVEHRAFPYDAQAPESCIH